jgi:hypothetical protein
MKQKPETVVRNMHRVHQYTRLNEQQLAATADVKNPNRFLRRAIAKQQRKERNRSARND